MAERKVRTRRTRTPVAAKTPTKAQLETADAALTELRNLLLKQEIMAKKIAEEKETLKAFMEKHGIKEVIHDDIEAEIAVPTQRKTRTIDPRAFWETVDLEEDFFACVSVSVTEAQKVLSGKELDSISKFHTAKAKPPELRVKMVKPKKGK